ncbi:hypothetical protein D0Z03_002755 [Geotrichum reessii]|nr:hypothetical protein D0Z03_002755 [Galactomyces reessii]
MLSRAVVRSAAPKAAFRRFASTESNPKIRSAFTYSADPAAGKAFIELEEETVSHSKQTAELWKKISIFVVAPILVVTGAWIYKKESEHLAHRAAHPRLPDDETPPEYDYQNVRTTKYFWGDGDKTLFWNDKYNYKKSD